MEVVPTVVFVAEMTALLAEALTPVSPILALMAAAMAIALPVLLLPVANALLFGSLSAKEAGMANEPFAV